MYTLIYHENSDAGCLVNTRYFSQKALAIEAMQEAYEKANSILAFPDGKMDDEHYTEKGDVSIYVHDGIDTYSWAIEEAVAGDSQDISKAAVGRKEAESKGFHLYNDTPQFDAERLKVDANLSAAIPFEKELSNTLAAAIQDKVEGAAIPDVIAEEEVQQQKMTALVAEGYSLINAWSREAAKLRLLQMARYVLEDHLPKNTTGNRWVEEISDSGWRSVSSSKISNNAFSAQVYITEEGKRCYASYYVSINANVKSFGNIIKDIDDRKAFKDMASAQKYAEGRKAMLEKTFFSSMDPVIPKEYEGHFSYYGVKLPQFKFED